jgi:hypothetical protein
MPVLSTVLLSTGETDVDKKIDRAAAEVNAIPMVIAWLNWMIFMALALD